MQRGWRKFALDHWRRILFWLALALAVGTPTYAALTSANYANCAQHQGQYPTKDNKYNKATAILVPAPSDVRIFWRCIGGYSNENGNAITAASTFLLLIVTALLGLVAFRQYTTSRAQLRAYVYPEGGTVLCPSQLTPPEPVNKDNPFVVWQIKNFGQTPAYDVLHWGEIDAREVSKEGQLAVPPMQRKSLMSLPPSALSGKFSYLGRVLSQAEIADLHAGRAIYLYGLIEYLDVFGTAHTTRYRLKYQGNWPPHPTGADSYFVTRGISLTDAHAVPHATVANRKITSRQALEIEWVFLLSSPG